MGEHTPTQESDYTNIQTVEWHDAEGWTEEILFWLLAWIDVVEEKGHLTRSWKSA